MAERCTSCGARVLFVATLATGRTQILDAEPIKRAVLMAAEPSTRDPVVSRSGAGETIYGIGVLYSAGLVRGVHPRVRSAMVDTYTDHHATCPGATDWRHRPDPEQLALDEDPL